MGKVQPKHLEESRLNLAMDREEGVREEERAKEEQRV